MCSQSEERKEGDRAEHELSQAEQESNLRNYQADGVVHEGEQAGQIDVEPSGHVGTASQVDGVGQVDTECHVDGVVSEGEQAGQVDGEPSGHEGADSQVDGGQVDAESHVDGMASEGEQAIVDGEMGSDMVANAANKANGVNENSGEMDVDGGPSGGTRVHKSLRNSSLDPGKQSDICDVSSNQDPLLRKTARKLVARSWDMLKLCTKVMEENEVMLSTMHVKEKLKENISWDIETERKFLEWKALNIKFLNLKDSKNKKEVKVSELEKFCAVKGLAREKSTSEIEYEKEIKEKDTNLKEMIAKKKLAKSKKKKLELIRECMKILQIVKEKKTFDDDLALEVKKLRKNILEDDLEDNLRSQEDDRHKPGHESKPRMSRQKTLKTPMKSQKKNRGKNSPASKLVSRLNLVPVPNVKRLAAMLEKEDPNYHNIASNRGKLPKLKVSKFI